MTKTVTLNEAQSQLQNLLLFANEGNEVVITKNNTPLARLVPVLSTTKSRIAGLSKGNISISDDFDAPLSDKYWLGSK